MAARPPPREIARARDPQPDRVVALRVGHLVRVRVRVRVRV